MNHPDVAGKLNAPAASTPASGSVWTTRKLLARNALLVCAIIEGSKAAGSPHLSFDFAWYACLSLCLLAGRDLITPNEKVS